MIFSALVRNGYEFKSSTSELQERLIVVEKMTPFCLHSSQIHHWKPDIVTLSEVTQTTLNLYTHFNKKRKTIINWNDLLSALLVSSQQAKYSNQYMDFNSLLLL